MINKVSRIVDHKARTKALLNKLRRDYLYAIYFGILNKKQWYEIHDKLIKETVKFRKYKNLDVSKMYMIATTILSETRGVPKDSPNTGLLLFLLLNGAYHWFKKPLNEIVNSEENILKSEYLTNMINDARESGQIFYLCSKHGDSAKDHVDWQGRIYVDEKWDRYDMDKGVLDFINGNQIHTIQWVISNPPYLVTRRNCRHFFRAIDSKDVLTKSVSKLIKENKTSFKSGNYAQMSSKKIAAIEKLKFYEELYKVSKESVVMKKIKRYREIISKMV